MKVQLRLAGLEKLRWRDILQSAGTHDTGSHAIPVNRICKAAQNRLAELKLDEREEVVSLRVDGASRVWGYLESGIMTVLWWDPDHEICPSPLRHT